MRMIGPVERRLTYDEVRFLAWVYVEASRRESSTDSDLFNMRMEWEDATGVELPFDFIEAVVAIHDAY